MVRTYCEIKNTGTFMPGHEIWAFAFVYANDKINKSNFQVPVLGQLQDRNGPPLPQLPPRGFTPIQYFVPYRKGKKELAWSKAVRVEARSYADTETEAQIAYNKRIALAQNWHYLSGILLDELCTDRPKSELHIVSPKDLPGTVALTWRQFIEDTARGRITDASLLYLAVGVDKCLDMPLRLDNERGIAAVVYETATQHVEFQVEYEDVGRMLSFGQKYDWRPDSQAPVAYWKI